jgi:hypothetical protein
MRNARHRASAIVVALAVTSLIAGACKDASTAPAVPGLTIISQPTIGTVSKPAQPVVIEVRDSAAVVIANTEFLIGCRNIGPGLPSFYVASSSSGPYNPSMHLNTDASGRLAIFLETGDTPGSTWLIILNWMTSKRDSVPITISS